MNDLDRRIANLSPAKRALLEKKLQQKAIADRPQSTGQRASETSQYFSPLSCSQQRMWLLDRLEPGNPVYNRPANLYLRGYIDRQVLAQSLQEILRRHAVLRAKFPAVNGQPVQSIEPSATLDLPFVDLGDLVDADRDMRLPELVIQSANCCFDLDRDLLIKATLVKLAKREHILLITFHHIIFDGWSMGIFIRELSAIYSAFTTGEPSPLPELTSQYPDFILWQQQHLSPERLQPHLNYWQKQLGGHLPILALPIDDPRPPLQTYRGAKHTVRIDSPLSEALKDLSQQQEVTLFMLLLAAFKALLYRYTDETDLLVGCPIAGRDRVETESLIGVFINTLIFRTQLDPEMSFVDLLERVRQVSLDAYAHQELPFEKLIEKLKPERSLSHSLLFQVMFQLRNLPKHDSIISEIEIAEFDCDPKIAAFDLTLDISVGGTGFACVFTYNTDLFAASTIERMAGHFQTLLTGIVANPHQPISHLPLLTAPERQQLLWDWNDMQTEYPQNICIHQLFEQQVAKNPNAVAVVFADRQLTYGELNTQANQLAHYLQTLGVKPEVLVGICVERSLEMVVGLLAILKAGGAYVPLDPSYPLERLSYMLADAGIEILLTQQKLWSILPLSAARVVCLDADWETIDRYDLANLTTAVSADNLVYVIYTSGSTGQPKGVEIEHQGLVNLVVWHQTTFGVTESDIATQLAGIAFDAAAWELWVYLIAGASLHLLPDPEMLLQPRVLQAWFRAQKISIAFLPTQLLENFIALDWSDPGDLRTILTGGDKLHQCPSPTLPFAVVNNYGPTENTVVTTSGTIVPTDRDNLLPSIGKPIANTQVYILDRQMQPVPIGVAGELYIGGDGLARGYLDRPELTSAKFILNPLDSKLSRRLYKTGDLARYRPDGSIEFLGRIDNQVKIRAFRIELGEIESALIQHPSVKATAVIAIAKGRPKVNENNIGKQLVAYIVPQTETTPSNGDFRNFLNQKLPDYMIPATFIVLDTLPLTPNGKIDTKALPIPEIADRQSAATTVLPQTSIQRTLASIWAEVLQLPQVGIHDNFFELGGDSIISIQIIARCHQALLQLTPKDLFQHQTIAELAQIVTSTEIIIPQGLVTGTIPLTPITHWFIDQNFPEPHHFNQSFLLEIAPDFTPELLQPLLQQLLLHHDGLRLRLSHHDDTWQIINAAAETTEIFSIIDLSQLSPAEQIAAIETITSQLQASLNLATGPIIRITLFQLGDRQPHRLLIIIHHLAIDGVSWRILLKDLTFAYQQLSRGETIQLPAKTTSFQDWAIRLTEYAQTPAALAELNYWLTRSDIDLAPLPVDYSSATVANIVADTAAVSVALSVEQTSALLQEVPKAYNTQINDVLLAALVQSFAQWTGQKSLLINLEGHGREELFADVNISRTIGWFSSIFPVLLKLEQAECPGQSLKSMKEQLRRIPNHGIGYGIIRYLNQDKTIGDRLQNLPLAQVSFNYLGQLDLLLSTWPILGLAAESSSADVSLQASRTHSIDIKGFVANGSLQLTWVYNTKLHHQATIERLADRFIASLTAIITHCLSSAAGGYTPTDFPDADLAQAELDDLVALLPPATQIESIYPLSPMQEGMLFHTLSAPNSGLYFEQLVFDLSGNLDVSAFERAWRRMVELHPILRTFLVWKNRQHPLQVACNSVNFPWHIYDWRSVDETEQQEHLQAFLQTDREQGFNLEQAPLMWCSIVRLTDLNYQFIWSHHHMLLDGWSWPIVLKQVWAFYAAFSQDEDLYLDPPPPYQNYIAWLRQQDALAARQFWRSTLAGFTAPTPLLVDKMVEGLSRHHDIYHERNIKLSATLTEAIEKFGRQNHLTLNTLFQGVWALLLSRYSGESDVLFGATVSGRSPTLSGVESMVGLFINTLPVRVQIDSETEVLSWLKQLQVQQVDREQYAYSSLVEIQGVSDVPRNLPLFDSIVVFENYPVDSALLANNSGVEISNIRVFQRTNYPLTVSVVPGRELSIETAYDSAHFDGDTIERMLGHLQTLLSGIITHHQGRVCELPMLTEPEQQQLLLEWNQTQIEYPQVCIYQLFEEQVTKTPDAIAVVFENCQLTYRELNERSNQLARHLQGLGVKPDVLVGIYVERSLEMVVGLLGILKAGGAYVPLDPTYPADRLAYMVADAEISILLTQTKWVSQLPDCQAQIICLDLDWEKIELYSPENLAGSNLDENLAYIIYTSGSTGQPKGVMISHQAVSCFVQAAISVYKIAASDRLLQFASINFDVAVEEIYPCLLTGATLVLRTDEMLADVRTFFQACDDLAISVVNLPTAYWHQLTTELVDRDVPLPKALRLAIVGGEKILPTAVKSWLEYITKQGESDRLQFINAYGPTETTVTATLYQIPADIDAIGSEIPIGRPLNRVRAYILDRQQQLVPVGVPGELHIGGDCLALGYLDRPELTTEKFIPDPFALQAGARLYKTGDFARYRADGNIEYIGRIDNQVKIRGFRIELGEIETVLIQHPAISRSTVIVREDTPGDKRLVAYIIPDRQQSPPPIRDLHEFLAQKLPRHSLPSAWVMLADFPTTPNGKIDRRALPVPDLTALLNIQTERTAPRNITESQLMAIWMKVLGLEELGIHDNFFDLGGHSLLAVNMFGEMERVWGVNLPLATLFQSQTIAELATVIALKMADLVHEVWAMPNRADLHLPAWNSLVKIKQGGSIDPPLFFIHDVSGSVLFYREIADRIRSNRTFYILQPRGMDGLTQPVTSVTEMAANYIAEILQVQPAGAYYLSGYSFGGFVAFEMARQLHELGKEVKLLAIIDTSAPRSGETADRQSAPPPAEPRRNHSRLAKFLSLNPHERIDYIRNGLRIHRTAGKLRLPYQFYLRYIKRSLSEAGSLDVYWTNERAFDRYVALSTYPGRVTLFYSDERLQKLPVNPALNWDKLATGGVELYAIPGSNHATIIQVPYVDLLGERLTSVLDRL